MATNESPTEGSHEAIVDCVAFFMKRGKTGRISERKSSSGAK